MNEAVGSQREVGGRSVSPAVFDLFCGAGGLSLGAHFAGFNTVAAVDADPDLTSTYLANFPATRLVNLDIAAASLHHIREVVSGFDVCGVIGGPPCQGFSEIGRRLIDDPRNALVGRFMEVVAAVSPAFFFMENVPPLGREPNRQVLDQALALLPSRFSVLPPLVLDSANYGAATRRLRLVVIGFNRDRMQSRDYTSLVEPTVPPATVRDAIDDLPEPVSSEFDEPVRYRPDAKISEYARALRGAPPCGLGSAESRGRSASGTVRGVVGTRHSITVVRRFRTVAPGATDNVSRYPRLVWDQPAPVLRAGTGRDRGSYQAARPIHPDQPRVITVREAARIQGFPDWFEFPSTKWHSHRMIGNSVSPVFAAVLLARLRTLFDQ